MKIRGYMAVLKSFSWKNENSEFRILKNRALLPCIRISDLISKTVRDINTVECALERSSLKLSNALTFSTSSHELAHIISIEDI